MATAQPLQISGVSYPSKQAAAYALRMQGMDWPIVADKIGSTLAGAKAGYQGEKKRLEAMPAHSPEATPGLWTPEKQAKVRRLFGHTMIHIADAVQVPASELLTYVLHGVIPPSQRVGTIDDIGWRGEQLQIAPAAAEPDHVDADDLVQPDRDDDEAELAALDVEPTHCSACGKGFPGGYIMCDEAMRGAWCPDCFEKTSCGRGEHGEGCSTVVFFGSDVPTPSPVVVAETAPLIVPAVNDGRFVEIVEAPKPAERFQAPAAAPVANAPAKAALIAVAGGLFPGGRMVRLKREDGQYLHESLQCFTKDVKLAWDGPRQQFDAVKSQMPKVVAKLYFEVVP